MPAAIAGRLPLGAAARRLGAAMSNVLDGASRRRIVLGLAGLAAIAATVSAAWFVSDRSQAQSARSRAAQEAASLSQESARQATADAFAGYIQLLRDADDPVVTAPQTPFAERVRVLQRQLELNTNRFSGLAVLRLDGSVEAVAGDGLDDAALSGAFAAVRADHGNSNSDVVITDRGRSYVDYATALFDSEHHPWGALVARGDAAGIWRTTVSASPDGGRNVIINQQGEIASGVDDNLVGKPWSASAFAAGTVRSRASGIDAVCGLSAIAADTQIDHGWNIATCLPVSRVLSGARAGSAQAGMIAAAVAALLLAGLAAGLQLRWAGGGVPDASSGELQGDETESPALEATFEVPAPTPEAPIEPAIDARMLMDAYESRNVRLATQLRGSVQAKLMVATARLKEAQNLEERDADSAEGLRERAIAELDALNEHDLRAISQELSPDLVRLGLPAALHALRKDVSAVIDVEVDADATFDSVDATVDRTPIDPALRTAMYRVALDAVHAFAAAGIEQCTVRLEPASEGLKIVAHADGLRDAALLDLDAATIIAEASGGTLTVESEERSTTVRAAFPVGAPVFEDESSPDVAEGEAA